MWLTELVCRVSEGSPLQQRQEGPAHLLAFSPLPPHLLYLVQVSRTQSGRSPSLQREENRPIVCTLHLPALGWGLYIQSLHLIPKHLPDGGGAV